MSSFPMNSGIYIAQKQEQIILFEVRGVYPTLKVGKGIALDKFFSGGKLEEASKESLANIELFPETWRFNKLEYINTGVFSKISFSTSGVLFTSEDDEYAIRNKYYRMCQMGISSNKIISALVSEFKVSVDQVLSIVNRWDEISQNVN